MSTLQQTMFVIACVATAILVIQIILMLISGAVDSGFDGAGASDAGDIELGGGASDIGDVDISGDIDGIDGIDGADLSGGMADADVSDGVSDPTNGGGSTMPFGLRLLSLRSILAFVTVGAWVCYTVCYALDWYYAVIIAVACGMVAACGMAAALTGMEKLQASGNINPQNAVGKTGTVYLTVPPKRSGTGKINVLVQERYAEYEAMTDSADPLPTSSDIKVVGRTGNVLIVEKLKKPSVTVDTINT